MRASFAEKALAAERGKLRKGAIAFALRTLSLSGGVGRDRTGDTRIFSPLLYRLSYRTIGFGIAKIVFPGEIQKVMTTIYFFRSLPRSCIKYIGL